MVFLLSYDLTNDTFNNFYILSNPTSVITFQLFGWLTSDMTSFTNLITEAKSSTILFYCTKIYDAYQFWLAKLVQLTWMQGIPLGQTEKIPITFYYLAPRYKQ